MANEIPGNRYHLTDAIIRQSEKINPSAGRKPEEAGRLDNGRSFQEILNEQISQRISFFKACQSKN